MARPLSDEKRSAILNAAAEVTAEHGVSGPISKIARHAGVAEGTVFVYFPDKNELLNALYLAIKEDMALALTTDLPKGKSLKAKARHVWNRYIEWGATHSSQRKAMSQLAVSDRITPATRELGGAAFVEIGAMLQEVLAGGALCDQPLEFAGAVMESLAEATLSFIAREPKDVETYKHAGFAAFWGAVSK